MSDHENESYSEPEEITDLSNPFVLLKYKTAADIVNKALKGVLTQCVAGKLVADICAFGDLLIEKQCAEIFKSKNIEKGIAFPTCVSVNDVVCHYSPYPDESVALAAGDVVKVDLGCHIDGYIAVAANTIVIPSDAMTEERKAEINDLMSAARVMGDLCQRMIKPGNNNNQVTEALSKVAAAYDVHLLQGILMHQMKHFVLDGNKVILGSNEGPDKADKMVFEPNEVYAVDIALTKGSGKTRNVGTRATVYRRNVEEKYLVKMKSSRAVLNEVDRRFPVFPFSFRALEEKSARMGLVECLKHNLLDEYPVINTSDRSLTVHYKFTVLLVPAGTDRITGETIDLAAYPSEKKVEDEEILKILKEAPMKKKSKKNKKSKKAAEQ